MERSTNTNNAKITNMVFIYTTCKTKDQARRLGKLIIESKLGACVDFWEAESCYNWQGELTYVSEVILLVTTLESKIENVNDLISQNHTYSVPIIAATDVRRINRAYKEWMTTEIA